MKRATPVLLLAVLAAGFAPAAFAAGISRAYMDTTVSPCADFFRYANGAWVDTATIPAAYTVIGAGREIADRNQQVLREVLDDAAAKHRTEKDPARRKIGALYAVLLDSARAERDDAKPLAPMLARIGKIESKDALVRELAALHQRGVAVPFRFFAGPDARNSGVNLGAVSQGGLGLPDRDDYFRPDARSDTLRREYVAHVARTLALLGQDEASARADAERVFALETALAESSLTRVENRDPQRTYNKMPVSALEAIGPAFAWRAFFAALGVDSLNRPDGMINVAQPRFVRGLSAQLEATPLSTWRAYLRFHLADRAAPWLSRRFFDENFRWTSRLSGQREPLPRWKRAIQTVDGALGEALGQAYVARAFPPDSKRRMQEMVDDLVAVMGERIDRLTWMSDATRAQARRKLASIRPKIGYPDTWRDYSALEIDPKLSAVENLVRAQEFESRRVFSRTGRPVDRGEWGMTPPTVNAYYRASNNEIVFPAGILQPPQFDPAADDAFNYGGIGMVIGHEITHGFDDRGRQYDADGNLKEWWTADDAARFKQRAQQVVDQYDGYVAVDTMRINGRLTLGENIADLGGVTLAYHAYQRYLGRHGRKDIDGFTPEQRFFLGFAQAWRRKARPETERLRTLTDSHSPAYWRVNGPLSNMDEFRAAFGCKAGDPLMRAGTDQISIW